jgi:hypothetical protein
MLNMISFESILYFGKFFIVQDEVFHKIQIVP